MTNETLDQVWEHLAGITNPGNTPSGRENIFHDPLTGQFVVADEESKPEGSINVDPSADDGFYSD